MTDPKHTPPPTPPAEPSPMAIIGAILAQGAIRLLDRQKREAQLANRTEESVHQGELATVTSVNEQLAQEKRDRALLSIDEKLAEVQAKLSAVSANPDVSNKALRLLQDLKARIAIQTSIAQILYLQGQGGDAMDEAITLIEAAVAVKPLHVAEPGSTTKPPQTGTANVPHPLCNVSGVCLALKSLRPPYPKENDEQTLVQYEAPSIKPRRQPDSVDGYDTFFPCNKS